MATDSPTPPAANNSTQTAGSNSISNSNASTDASTSSVPNSNTSGGHGTTIFGGGAANTTPSVDPIFYQQSAQVLLAAAWAALVRESRDEEAEAVERMGKEAFGVEEFQREINRAVEMG